MSQRKKRKKRQSGDPAAAGDGGQALREATPPPARERQKTAFDAFRENWAEPLIVAVLLAIIIRHFAVEAFEIPTGSMAPTLLGMHVTLECPNCSTDFDAGISTDSTSGAVKVPFERLAVYSGDCPNPQCTLDLHPLGGRRVIRGQRVRCGACGQEFSGPPGGYKAIQGITAPARCPLCHFQYRAVVDQSTIQGGHKILVNKFAFQLGPPRRWDVVVFEFDQWKNYIKRLVGLPGERVEICDGDVYVNGKIVRKSDHPYVQDVMWRQVSDSDVPERGLQPVAAWKDVTLGGSRPWSEIGGGRWSLNSPDPARVAVLDYRRGFSNYVPYNLLLHGVGGAPAHVEVGDKKVAFTVRPVSGQGWIGAQIRDGDYDFRACLPVGSGAEIPAVLERLVTESVEGTPRPDRPPHPGGPRVERRISLPFDVAARVELENVDDRVALRLDGEEILSATYTSCPDLKHRPRPNGQLPQALRLLGFQVQATVESIQVYQDTYYLDRPSTSGWPGGVSLGEGQYFVLGDNSPSSSDGRYWHVHNYVPESNLMGKALLVFWPAWPTNFQWKFIR